MATAVSYLPEGQLARVSTRGDFSPGEPGFQHRLFPDESCVALGSALFLLWQQNRSGFVPVGDRVRPGNLFDAVTATGDNFLVVKFAYWLGG